MTKEYEVIIKTEYRGAESIWIYADTAAAAISKARRTARLEGWFDLRNDGKVIFKTNCK